MDGGADIDRSLRLARPALEDFAYIAKRMRPDEIAQFLAMGGMAKYDPDLAARAYAATPGPTFALIDAQNMPVLLGGFVPKRRGVYEAWMAGTMEAWDAHWFAITREAMRRMDELLTVAAHRIEICALASRTRAHTWYEHIGFKREGVLHAYCANGEDAIMFARTA